MPKSPRARSLSLLSLSLARVIYYVQRLLMRLPPHCSQARADVHAHDAVATSVAAARQLG